MKKIIWINGVTILILESDAYRVWFEYLIRTPLFKKWYEHDERINNGEDLSTPDDVYSFWNGYGVWFNHDWPWEVYFPRCYTRLQHHFRETRNNYGYDFESRCSLAREISYTVATELGEEEIDLGRQLTEKEKEYIIERFTEQVITERENRNLERLKSDKYLAKYRYKTKPPNVSLGNRMLGTLKRRLNYYNLEIIAGLSRNDIIFGEIPHENKDLLPFGKGPFVENPRARDHFQYWKLSNLSDRPDPRHFLSEEIAEAKKTIAAVEAGWFPSVPKF